MTIAAGQKQPPDFQDIYANYDVFEEDPPAASGSPKMKRVKTALRPYTEPPLNIPAARVSFVPLRISNDFQTSNRSKIRPTIEASALVRQIGNGCRPEIERAAGFPGQSGIEEVHDEGNDYQGNDPAEAEEIISKLVGEDDANAFPAEAHSCDDELPYFSNLNEPTLQHLAAGALEAVSRESQSSLVGEDFFDIAYTTRQMSLNGHQSPTNVLPQRNDAPGNNSPSQRSDKGPMGTASSTGPVGNMLAPIRGSNTEPEAKAPSLPSIRKIFEGKIFSQPSTIADEESHIVAHGSEDPFTRSPRRILACLSPKDGSRTAPPKSSKEADQPSLTSPYPPSASSSYSGYKSTGLSPRPSIESGIGLPRERPRTQRSASTSTPATAVSVADRMSINGITNPSKVEYRCTHPGCEAPAFQTQYLLNSHANVHSDARPHYCPVEGCPRSKGGNGFKRKNEMIRHGLVHTSPGYVCPFCPEREHKYPRPDNLQR
ncbi:hypothetical protein E4U42_000036 [Claviceps africana]|uniref:Uncharacterized protein n=1 Tax=Claviceps africana TaxID=83212 RepID=A0A8K0JFU3_9HYPO|nr:hypothetical protein E4U42_000036 [Claviceps africana]